jgi:transposase
MKPKTQKDLLKIKLPAHLDRRIKLGAFDHENIRKLHTQGHSIREIARIYENKCSRRTIQMVIRPELRERLKENFKKNRSDGRYKPTKEKWAQTMREHRQYKKSVLRKYLSTGGTIKA